VGYGLRWLNIHGYRFDSPAGGRSDASAPRERLLNNFAGKFVQSSPVRLSAGIAQKRIDIGGAWLEVPGNGAQNPQRPFAWRPTPGKSK
jgi:hypothetical protein